MRMAWLASLARTSRRWPAAVYSVLYRLVIVLGRIESQRLVRTLEAAPDVGQLVRTIILPGRTAVASSDWEPSPEVYRRILRCCTGLERPIISNAYNASVVMHADAPWKQTVTDLAIYYVDGDCPMPYIPQLKRLRISGPRGELLGSAGVDFRPNRNLELLDFSHILMSEQSVRAILACFQKTLKTLRCTRLLAQTMQSIATGSWNTVVASPSDWLLPVRRALTELRLAGCGRVKTLRDLENLQTLSIDLASLPTRIDPNSSFLPRSIRTVVILTAMSLTSGEPIARDVRGTPWDYAQRPWDIVKLHDACPNLKTVTVSVDLTREVSIYKFTIIAFMIKPLAELRGVEVNFDLNVKFFRNGDSFNWTRPPKDTTGAGIGERILRALGWNPEEGVLTSALGWNKEEGFLTSGRHWY